MIKYTPQAEISNQLFKTPFDHVLSPTNRWVVLEGLIPWDEFAAVLMKDRPNFGRNTIDLRLVLGATLIKGVEDLSDEDVVRQIQENIYMQYFVGYRSFQSELPFTPEVLVSVRKHLGEDGMAKLNDIILKQASDSKMIKQSKEYGQDKENRGVLKIDATAAPQDVKYPTDVGLLNDARLFCEQLIDTLYKLGCYGDSKKPRTYRRVAAERYLNFAKKKRPKSAQVQKAIRQQLQYLKRNMKHINKGFDSYQQAFQTDAMPKLNALDYRKWLTVQHIYDQQLRHHKDKRQKIQDRIVNLRQPWVRPIVRGKVAKPTEFGAKINMSEIDGFVRMDKIDFNNFNEGKHLEDVVEGYKELYGFFPESVLVDKIYLNRSNRKYLDEHNINHYGAPLGRPPKTSQSEKVKRKKKQNKRSEIEGKFGLAKVKFGLGRIKMRLAETSKAHIGLIAISMNICRIWAKMGDLGFNFAQFVLSLCVSMRKQSVLMRNLSLGKVPTPIIQLQFAA